MSDNMTGHAQWKQGLLPYSGNHLDRAESRRGDAAWLQDLAKDPSSKALLFAHLKPRLIDDRIDWQPLADLDRTAPSVFLGLMGDSACFAVDVTPTVAGAVAGFDSGEDLPECFVDARKAAAILPYGDSAIVAQGRSLLDWHARHGFCAKCGAATEMGKGGLQRVCRAESCKAEHFPRVDPVVIMLVTRGDHCLLGRQAGFPPGMMSTLAGFIEAGETIEEAVRREVLEETGVPVGQVRYLMSQPWPFPSNLMIGCTAEALDDRITIDPNELETAAWYSRDAVRAAFAGDETAGFWVPNRVAVAHHLLKHWVST